MNCYLRVHALLILGEVTLAYDGGFGHGLPTDVQCPYHLKVWDCA